VAYALGKEDSFVNSHLKNALVVIIIGLFAIIFQLMGLYLLSAIFHIITLVLTILGIIYAILDKEEIPLVSQVYENHLSQYLEWLF